MTVYIAASWKHEHLVELVTRLLEARGHAVKSFVREAAHREPTGFNLVPSLDEWIASSDGARKFIFGTTAATESDVVIYLGPSGADAWAEVGIAWSSGKPVLGLTAKGESIGLMRRMVRWSETVDELLLAAEKADGERLRPPEPGS
jgi:hypothetical protein